MDASAVVVTVGVDGADGVCAHLSSEAPGQDTASEAAATDFRLSVDFFMRLRWKDPRIQFKDLRDEMTLNPLSDEEITSFSLLSQ